MACMRLPLDIFQTFPISVATLWDFYGRRKSIPCNCWCALMRAIFWATLSVESSHRHRLPNVEKVSVPGTAPEQSQRLLAIADVMKSAHAALAVKACLLVYKTATIMRFRTEPGIGLCLRSFWTIFACPTSRRYGHGILGRFGTFPAKEKTDLGGFRQRKDGQKLGKKKLQTPMSSEDLGC